MVYVRVGHWVAILLGCTLRVSSRFVQFLLPTTHTMLQANIEDDPEKKLAVRDSNRERKRRQRCSWICNPISSHDCVMVTEWICIPIICLCHGHCMNLLAILSHHTFVSWSLNGFAFLSHVRGMITADCAQQARSTDA